MDVVGALIGFLGGIGAGSVIAALIQHHLQQKVRRQDLLWSERSEVFKGLLGALEALEVANSVENSKRFGFWVARTSLVSSVSVVERLAALRATEPNTTQRDLAMSALLSAMRIDLGMKSGE